MAKPAGHPILIHISDLRRVARGWMRITAAIRHDATARKMAVNAWVAELYGFALAAADVGLPVHILDSAGQYPPRGAFQFPLIMHYGLKFKVGPTWAWDKHFPENYADFLAGCPKTPACGGDADHRGDLPGFPARNAPLWPRPKDGSVRLLSVAFFL